VIENENRSVNASGGWGCYKNPNWIVWEEGEEEVACQVQV